MSALTHPPQWVINRIKETLELDGETGRVIRRNHPREWLNNRYAGTLYLTGTGGEYRRISFRDRKHGRVHIQEHHIVYFLSKGVWPPLGVDHRDRNGTNNKPQNLRLATPSQQQHNTGRRIDNSSGAKGVSWSKTKKMFHAYIKPPGSRRIHIGYFSSIEDAAKAYADAAARYYGEFYAANDSE
jgi:hypothetical protein